MAVNRSEAVRRSWVTRRAKYGPSGSKAKGRNLGVALRMPNSIRQGGTTARPGRGNRPPPEDTE